MFSEPIFHMTAEIAAQLRFSRRGNCDVYGCTDPECCCSLCGEPIGIAEGDVHYDTCEGCDRCGETPIYLFRGQGNDTEQAQLHNKCFGALLNIKVGV